MASHTGSPGIAVAFIDDGTKVHDTVSGEIDAAADRAPVRL
jgi:hypothetical protein